MIGYTLIMAPVLELFTTLEKTITQMPNTPHEVRFQRRYGEMIDDLMRQIRNPTNDELHDPVMHWTQLAQKLIYSHSKPIM